MQNPLKNKKFRQRLVPAILITVAINHIILTHTTFLSPWKGGGFGMFAVVKNRALSCEVIDQYNFHRNCIVPFSGRGEKGPLTAPRKKSFRQFPTQSRLEDLADDLFVHQLKVRTYAADSDFLPGFRGEEVVQESSVKGLRLQMWDVDFDNDTGKITMIPSTLVATRGQIN